MHIEVVSIGDELLKGMVVNTNAAFISRVLFENGYEVSRHTVFSDDPPILDKELRAALSRSSIIITTGGLGATLDDHTRNIAAVLFSSEFEYNPIVAEDLHRRYGTSLPGLNEVATIPSKAIPLLNTVGTSPGLVFTTPNKMLILLPGIPLEMQAMLTEKVLPLLKSHMPAQKARECIAMHLCLLAESAADPILRELKERYPDVHVGIYPSYGSTTIFLHSQHLEQLKYFKAVCETKFSTYLYASPNGNIEEALQSWFVQHKKYLAVAESCTGGTIASRIVSIAGASDYFLGSFVVYCDAFKKQFLGVSDETLKSDGAVSRSCVKEMLEGIFKNSTANFAIAVSGIAGPSGGSLQKPVGTVWVAIGERGKAPDIGSFAISGPRAKVIQASTQYILGALFRKVAYGIAAFK